MLRRNDGGGWGQAHSWGVLLLAALLVLLALILLLASRTAAAQSQRGVELIERALQAKSDERAGRGIYDEHCASCHDTTAYGRADEVIPALAGQLPVYLIKQMVDMAEAERTNPEMHRVVARKSLSTPQSLRDVASYLGSLGPNPKPETGDGTQLDLGKRYYQGLCAYCHGPQGGGNEAHATPALRRQNYAYLLMQMRELSAGHRATVDIDIVDTLQRLPYEHLTAIADYASRLPMVQPISATVPSKSVR
jgi:cytochrome c553